MKIRPMISVIAGLALFMTLISPLSQLPQTQAAGVKLSSKSLTINLKKSKTLKMKGTSRKVTWSIQSGKSYIKLKNKKKQQVTITGKKVGTAKVKGVITYSKKRKATYTCKVKVVDRWECPVCGFTNTGKFCENCGHSRYETATPAPTASAEVTSTPTPSPTATPAPEEMSNRSIVMSINNMYYFNVQLYANASATTFYNSVVKGTMPAMVMGPDGENEVCAYLDTPITPTLSKSYEVEAGEIFLYGTDVLKLSANAHLTGAQPTRIGRVIAEHVSMLAEALERKVDGRTVVQFRQYLQ